MLRNDGIGSLPGCRIARNIAIGTADQSGWPPPTPGRSPLPKRIPGDTDPDQDPRLRLTGARAVASAPKVSLAESVEVARATVGAREGIKGHMPSRHGDCPKCDESAPCRPFSRALAILDRWDPGRARRVRSVLSVLALPAPPVPTRGALDDA